MKTNWKFVMIVVLAALSATDGHCGIKLTSGSLDFLNQENQVNVEFVYDGMTVCSDKKTKKEPEPEQDFVTRKVAEYNQKAAGRGDTWRENWVADRAAVLQPKFCELLNKYLSAKKMDLQFGPFKNAKYTLILKTTYTEIGWKFSDIIKHPFLIDAKAAFVETQKPANVRAEITITASGSADGSDFSTRRGLVEAYGNAGKELGSLISRKPKSK
jgi:hypothetical protein